VRFGAEQAWRARAKKLRLAGDPVVCDLAAWVMLDEGSKRRGDVAAYTAAREGRGSVQKARAG
jgi:hypothetical protein